MQEVWETFRIHNSAGKRFVTHATTPPKREISCYLYRVLSQERITLFILIGQQITLFLGFI